MNRRVLVTDPAAIAAVTDGTIDGDAYNDGEVYANEEELKAWALARFHEADGGACACGHGPEAHGLVGGECEALGCSCLAYEVEAPDGEIAGP